VSAEGLRSRRDQPALASWTEVLAITGHATFPVRELWSTANVQASAGAGPGIALPMQLMDGLRTGRVLYVTLDDDDDVIGVDAVLVGLTRIGFSPQPFR